MYSSPDIIRMIKLRRMRWPRNVLRIGDSRGVYSALVGKPDGKKPLGGPTRRWGIILKCLQEVGW
jgi:hypothetical protein